MLKKLSLIFKMGLINFFLRKYFWKKKKKILLLPSSFKKKKDPAHTSWIAYMVSSSFITLLQNITLHFYY